MVDIKDNEKYAGDDATAKCSSGNNALGGKIKELAANLIAAQKSTKLEKSTNKSKTYKVNDRTQMRKWAIADAGATGHFMMMGAPVVNMKPATKPITIKLPDGKDIQSTHTCNLNIPWLPPQMTEAHIVPGMAH